MPSQSPPLSRRRRQPSATASPPAPTVTTIHDLGNDLLRDIFLRLPSLPSLVRAALTCRGFLAAVRSSAAFRRRFRALHHPPLLGFFTDVYVCEDVPSFSPIRRCSDLDTAAALRGADFFLTRIPYHHHEDPSRWYISECRGGCLLLISDRTRQIAVYNPLTRALDLFPTPPDDNPSDHHHDERWHLNFFLLCSDQSPGSFRVVFYRHRYFRSSVRASIFSSDTREWQIVPWPETAQPSDNEYFLCLGGGTQMKGKLYWAHEKHAYMVVLDTAALQFSWIDLPEQLKGCDHLFKLGGTKDGKLCIVSVDGFTLSTWLRRADAGGAEEWILHDVIPLEEEILQATDILEDEVSDHTLEVQAVLDGVVYMSITGEDEDEDVVRWFFSFFLETRNLEKLWQNTLDRVCPYIMGWPTCLIGNDIYSAV